ncbi:MAG: hypothetical protein HZC14_02460 [Candidatus Niyogibacteria bacterium]|nr:hypothetical protein [Candidatus Niyogibacteria bacterium]
MTCSGTTIASFKDFLCQIINILNSAIPVLLTLATVVFLWGVIQFIYNADNEKKRKDGRAFIIYGLIGLFVIVSMWGLVGVLLSTFSITDTTIPSGPAI